MTRPDDVSDEIGRAYDRHAPSLYRYAVMVLADPDAAADAVQHVFLALLRRPLAAVSDIERYLRRATRNECFTMLRRRHRAIVRAVDTRILEAVAGTADCADERMALERALRALPAEQREVVHLKVFEGWTYQEIAELAGEPLNTIASRYRYAIEKLRAELTHEG